MKKIIINESQLEAIREMAYPATFNMEEFKSIRSFADRLRYCENRLKKLGAGTSRRVYQIDNEKCLKLAKNRKGIAQNIEEINLGNDMYAGGCFAKVYDYDQNGLFVEMELARKAKEALGNIRGKFSGKVNIPQAEMTMDYQMLIQQGKEEYAKAMDALEKRLERLRPVNVMKEQAELVENHNKIQQYTPLGIYVI